MFSSMTRLGSKIGHTSTVDTVPLHNHQHHHHHHHHDIITVVQSHHKKQQQRQQAVTFRSFSACRAYRGSVCFRHRRPRSSSSSSNSSCHYCEYCGDDEDDRKHFIVMRPHWRRSSWRSTSPKPTFQRTRSQCVNKMATLVNNSPNNEYCHHYRQHYQEQPHHHYQHHHHHHHHPHPHLHPNRYYYCQCDSSYCSAAATTTSATGTSSFVYESLVRNLSCSVNRSAPLPLPPPPPSSASSSSLSPPALKRDSDRPGKRKRPVSVSFSEHNCAKVMLITIALCLTVSSCQTTTLYSVIDSDRSRSSQLFEQSARSSKAIAAASPNDAGRSNDTENDSLIRQQIRLPITYMPVHINQLTSSSSSTSSTSSSSPVVSAAAAAAAATASPSSLFLIVDCCQHANRAQKTTTATKRLRRRSRRSNKFGNGARRQWSSSAHNSKHDTATAIAAFPSTPPSLFVPSYSSFSSSYSSSFSPLMLSSSILAAKMKPPYVGGVAVDSSFSSSPSSSSSASSSSFSSSSFPSTSISASFPRSLQVNANQHAESSGGSVPRNITAQVGHPVYLHCIVESLGDKMVSWIRLRDFHLLTIGSLTFSSDDRFVVRPASHLANDWSLQIKHVTVKDEGQYECQINSDPPRSQYYYLHVVVPVAEIVGNPDIFVRSGAPINLTCLISSSPEPPAFVFWYHNNRMINYDYNIEAKGQISVQKDPARNDVVISRLFIKQAKLDDSGNYTCTPSNAEPASSYVHVLQGEKRMSNQIQNDWGHTDQLNNEGHHSGEKFSRFRANISTLFAQVTAILFAIVATSQICPYNFGDDVYI